MDPVNEQARTIPAFLNDMCVVTDTLFLGEMLTQSAAVMEDRTLGFSTAMEISRSWVSVRPHGTEC